MMADPCGSQVGAVMCKKLRAYSASGRQFDWERFIELAPIASHHPTVLASGVNEKVEKRLAELLHRQQLQLIDELNRNQSELDHATVRLAGLVSAIRGLVALRADPGRV